MPLRALLLEILFVGSLLGSVNAAPSTLKLSLNLRIEWEIDEVLVTGPIKPSADLETRLTDPATSESERANILATKKNIEETNGLKTEEKQILQLDIITDTKFKAVQTFIDPATREATTTMEYIAPGNGLVYSVDRKNKKVSISSKPFLILSGVARGIPEIAMVKFPALPAGAVTTVVDGAQVSKIEAGGEGMSVTRNPETNALEAQTLWSSDFLRQCRVLGKPYPGTAIPTELSYISWAKKGKYLKEDWHLKKVEPISPSTEIDYFFEKGYTISDQTGGSNAYFPSDLLINGK